MKQLVVWDQGAAIAAERRLTPQARSLPLRSGFGKRLRLVAIALGLSVVGLIAHHSWLTTTPLSAADWGWISSGQATSYFPWPSIWDATTGFGVKTFAGSNSEPIFAFVSWLAQVGVPWSVSEKLFFFLPLAVLTMLGPWAFARYLFRDSRWALLSSLIFAGN